MSKDSIIQKTKELKILYLSTKSEDRYIIRNKIFELNKGLAHDFINKLIDHDRHSHINDIYQVSYEAFLKAITVWCENNKDNNLSSYVFWNIYNAINKLYRQHNFTMYIPINVYLSWDDKLETMNSINNEYKDYLKKHTNLNKININADIDNIINKILTRINKKFPKTSIEYLHKIITLRFCEDYTLEEIGNKFGVTREAIRKRIDLFFRYAIKNKELRDYVKRNK